MSTTSTSASKPSGQWQPPTLEEMQAMLPQYRFEKLLGRGGMGAVYKAVQASLDRPVAIKVLPVDLVDGEDSQFAERFKNEARTMAKLSHPGIVDVFDFGETRTGLLYIVMEFIEGTDIAQMIQSQGKLPEDYALSITAHACDALAYAHQNGIVHRDIKPANILINLEGAIKVADFGLAKANDPGQSGITKTNMAMGTPDFVAPEAFIPGVPLDGRADLYAIGVMLYQMLTGEIPRGIWTLPGMKIGTDPRFDAIITKAMQTDREVRYQTATDIRRDLDTILTLPRSALIAQQQAAAEAAAQASREARQQEAAAAQAPRKGPQVQARAPQPVVKKPSSNGLIFGIAAIVIAAAGAFFIFGGGDKLKPDDTAAASSAPNPASDTPKQTAPPATGKTSTAFSNFVPTAVWRDAMSGDWPPGWTLVGTERHLTGTGLSMRQFPQTGPNAGIRARFRSKNPRQFFDLILRMKQQEGGRRYAVTMWTHGTQGAELHVVSGKNERRKLSSFSSRAAMEVNEEHSAELYAVGNRLTFFFDGQMLANAEDASYPDGHPAIFAGPGIEIISLELAELGGSVPVVTPAMPTAVATAAPATTPGAINLLAGLDVAKNTISGDWRLVNGELVSDTMSADSEITLPVAAVPAEYDVRYHLTRFTGHQMQFRFLHGDHGVIFITDGWTGNRENRSEVQVKWGGPVSGMIVRPTPLLRDGKPHDLVMQVRADRITALLDGQEVLRRDGGGNTTADASGAFSLRVIRGKVTFHAIELIPVKAAPVAAIAPAPMPTTPADKTATTPVATLRDDFRRKSVSLIPLVDVRRDVVGDPTTGANVWKSKSSALTFTDAEKAGRIAAPVSLKDARAYEIDLLWKRRPMNIPGALTSDSGYIALDVPVGADRWVRVDVAWAGDKVNVGGQRVGFTGPGTQGGDGMRVVVRCQDDKLSVTINGNDIGSVNGLAGRAAADFGAHATFKSELLPAVYCARGDHEIVEWTVRTLDGDVRVLLDPALLQDPRLAQLESGFQARFDSDAQKPYLTALASLNQSYIANGIGKARAAAQAKGSLAEVTACDAEKALVEKEGGVPGEDAADTPEPLKKLRTTYRATLGKITAERDAKAAPLLRIYLQALDSYISELSRAGKTDKAQAIQTLRDMKAASR